MTDTLKGIEPGQRVRVTFEGVVEKATDGLDVVMDASIGGASWWASDAEINAPSFKIEPIEEPLAIKDRVRFKSNINSTQGVIVAFDPHPVIRWEPAMGANYYDVQLVNDLERVK